MALSEDQIKEIENRFNKISSEIILAKPDTDEGLIPIYSLLNEIGEIGEDNETLSTSTHVAIDHLDRLLDEFKPWDTPSIELIQLFVDWLQDNIHALRMGKDFPYFSSSQDTSNSNKPPSAAATPQVEEAAQVPQQHDESSADQSGDAVLEPDHMLELDIEEDRELLTEFQTEALEHLEAIEQAVLLLELDPKEPESMAALFRAYHTIKGVAGFLHLVPIQLLAHEVESLLDLARTDQLTLDSAMISIILESRDVVQNLVDQISAALEHNEMPNEIVPVNGLIQRVKYEMQRGLAEAKGETTATPTTDASTVAEPPVEDPSKGFFDTHTIEPPTAHSPSEEVLSQRLQAPDTVDAQTPTVASPAPTQPPQPSSAEAPAKKAATERASIRVNTHKLDGLMDMVGELVIVQSQLQESSREHTDSALQRNLNQLSRITKDLQHTSMALRMVPIKPTFQRTARMVRDLSKSMDKNIHLEMHGEDTELDRNVVEQIGDPLVHMIRNAIDHGLEDNAERVKLGKSEAGNICLSAYHQGSSIIIELKDDGRGIDPDIVLEKAIKNGVAQADAQYTHDEIFQFIFMPGFSTAKAITDISGRGVGMDVVKRNIEKLRGTVEIASDLGKGSTFKIILPLTMAIIDGLVVRVGNDKFILPTTSVKIAIRPEAKQITKIQGRAEVLDLRNKTVPITRLHARFDIQTEITDLTDGILVIVESLGKPHALLVDEMISKQEVVIKSLGSMMQALPGVAGGAILGDGSIALILDPASLFSHQSISSVG